MTVLKIVSLILIMMVLPVGMGLSFKKTGRDAGLSWVCGMMLMWAVTLVAAVPLVYMKKSLTMLTRVLGTACIIIFVISVTAYILRRIKGTEPKERRPLTKAEIIYLGLFIGLVAFQLYKAVFYSYADGDDAFYVATAQLADASDKMYLKNPYNGGLIGLESKRYTLAPFPMWVASVAKISGLNAATVSHIFMPLFLIPLTYCIYNGIGEELFGDSKEKKYMFLVLIAVIALFSGYTFSSAERFMLTRTRQGKEALANIIIPFAFLNILKISKKASSGEKEDISSEYLFLLLITGFAGALTSLFSNVLLIMLIGCLAIYLIFAKKRIKTGIITALTLIPEAAVLLLYLVLR